jgi:hypothetical protein
MTRDEALKMALEVLRRIDEVAPTAMAKLVMPEIEQALKQPKQEPVAYLCENAVGHKYFRWKKPSSTYKPIALYTTPPQRTWVGLTNEELTDLFYNTNLGQQSAVGQAIELLRERNT